MHHCHSGLPQHRFPPCHNTLAACFFGAICGLGPITSLTRRSTSLLSVAGRLWSLWSKGRAVGNAQRFPRQAPWFAEGELSTNPQATGFGSAARCSLGLTSPYRSTERRADFSLITRTVAWADKPAFLQGWVR